MTLSRTFDRIAPVFLLALSAIVSLATAGVGIA
jgi:hypothetical protein